MNHQAAYKKILDIFWEGGESKKELEEKLSRIESIADEMYHDCLQRQEDEANAVSKNGLLKLINLLDDTPTRNID